MMSDVAREPRRLTLEVDHGGGAFGSIPDPVASLDGGLEWCLRYAPQHHDAPLQAASVVGTFDYLLSDQISMAEATRRLRQMRAIRRPAAEIARVRAIWEQNGGRT